MGAAPVTAPVGARAADLYVPAEWAPRALSRDVALDLLRGLAMVVLLVNHTQLDPGLGHITRNVLSAAEVLVGVSGVVVGMVFGRRWLDRGGRATTVMLLRRARKLYLASFVVVALVGVARLVPYLGSDALAVSPNMAHPVDAYAYEGALRTLLAIVTLEAGPWQFNILGFFIASLVAAPILLWALARGWWPAVLAASWRCTCSAVSGTGTCCRRSPSAPSRCSCGSSSSSAGSWSAGTAGASRRGARAAGARSARPW